MAMSSIPDPEARPPLQAQADDSGTEQVPTPPNGLTPEEIEADRRSALTTLVVVAGVAGVMLYMGYGRAIAAFLITLGILVFVHEWGHYQFARWSGMKVNRFGIGFPPWLFTRHYKGIDYSLGALPIGGMVDIAGLGSEEEMMGTVKGAELNVRPSRPDVPHGKRQFQDASLGWRFMTLFAGPMMNFIFAIVMYISVFSLSGVPDIASTNKVDSVSAGDPAAAAGVKAGDYIIGINNVDTTDTEQLTKLIRSSGGKPVIVKIKRGNEVLQKTLTPVFKELAKLTGEGTERAPAIGIRFYADPDKVHFHKVGLLTAVDLGWRQAIGISTQILHLVGRAATFRLSPDERKDVGGPVKIAQAAGEVAKQGWQASALFAAGLSVNLGLLNLLPLPALDGGRILFLGYELVARRPLDPKKESLVHMAGMVMLLAFMLFITVRDVLPWVTEHLGKVFKV